MVTVYSKRDCMQCKMTKKVMADRGIDFEERNCSDNEAYLDEVRALGYQSLPVIVTDTTHWSGFRPDKIHSLE